MKYKVGDIVRVTRDPVIVDSWNELSQLHSGDMAKIIRTREPGAYYLDIDEGRWPWYDKELQRVADPYLDRYNMRIA